MKSYGQFCPIAKAAEVFAERWTPLILRELFCGSVRFNDLRRGVPLMSPSLLSRRLKELEQAGVVRCTRGAGRTSEYRLTEAGQALWPLVEQLGVWGKRWTRSHIEKHELDAGLLMWDIRRNLRVERVPPKLVVEFVFAGTSSGKRRWWLLVNQGQAELCVLNPGFDPDLQVKSHIHTLTSVWLGSRSYADALASGEIALTGPKQLTRAFESWFRWSGGLALERGAEKSGARDADANVRRAAQAQHHHGGERVSH